MKRIICNAEGMQQLRSIADPPSPAGAINTFAGIPVVLLPPERTRKPRPGLTWPKAKKKRRRWMADRRNWRTVEVEPGPKLYVMEDPTPKFSFADDFVMSTRLRQFCMKPTIQPHWVW